MARAPRQAVIMIHGIGERQPMSNLRSLLDGLDLKPYTNRRDRLSGSEEVRRFSLPARPRERPPTDFFEFYWAHHMSEKTTRAVLYWAARLLWRRSAWQGTPLARTLNVLTALAVALVLAACIVMLVPTWREQLLSWATSPPKWMSVLVLPTATAALGMVVGRYLSDTARYLTPQPSNIEARSAIRKQGIDLLRQLHASGTYQRVVVVGHSLGSVIGYDILCAYWDEARLPDATRISKQPQVEAFREAAGTLPAHPSRAEIEEFQQAQHRLWREQRAIGVPWLVTDFITVGSPLANAKMLMESGKISLEQLIAERQLPACPPVSDDREPTSSGFYKATLTQSDGHSGSSPLIRTALVGNSAAVFASTRWTNLYVPVRALIGGDLVGGPIAAVLGRGVRDIPVRRTPSSRPGAITRIFPFSHGSYWSPYKRSTLSASERKAENRRLGTEESNPALRQALGLDILRSKYGYPDPEPAAEATAGVREA